MQYIIFGRSSSELLTGIEWKNVGYGSLTFGGYDSTRYEPNDVSFRLAGDVSRDLVVGLKAITTTSSDGLISLLPSPIWTFIDSTQAMIYLSNASCKVFEDTFGLVWDETDQNYWVDDDLHVKLKMRNPTINFTLGDSLETKGPTLDIVLPYASFDLAVKHSIADNKTRVFPLRRAFDESQYTLGRTFLQEA